MRGGMVAREGWEGERDGSEGGRRERLAELDGGIE